MCVCVVHTCWFHSTTEGSPCAACYGACCFFHSFCTHIAAAIRHTHANDLDSFTGNFFFFELPSRLPPNPNHLFMNFSHAHYKHAHKKVFLFIRVHHRFHECAWACWSRRYQTIPANRMFQWEILYLLCSEHHTTWELTSTFVDSQYVPVTKEHQCKDSDVSKTFENVNGTKYSIECWISIAFSFYDIQ